MSDEQTVKDNEYWRDKLSPEQYHVTREKGTEPAFSGEYWNTKEEGAYHCRCCGAELFHSRTKYDSGTGWPSFYQPADPAAVRDEDDSSHGMVRTEVVCDRCDAHLGHVFEDGPQPTGLRYCINSASIQLKPGGGADPAE